MAMASAQGGAPRPVPPVTPHFAVGQVVDVRVGEQWVRGRVEDLRSASGTAGPEPAYGVRFDDGRRGVFSAMQLRARPR
jgi:hypothetical protein